MASTKIFQDRASVTFNESRHTYSLRVPGANVDKLWQPSVTGILGIRDKPALINWAVGQHREYVERKLAQLEVNPGELPFLSTADVRDILAEAQECWRDLSGAASIGSLAHRFLHAELGYRAGVVSEQPKMTIEPDEILAPSFSKDMIDLANASVKAGLQFLDENHVEPLIFERILWSPTYGYVGTADLIAKVNGILSVLDWKTSKAIYPEYNLQTAAYSNAYMEEFGSVIQDRYVVNIKKDGGLEVEKRDLETYSEDLGAFLACLEVYRWNRANDKYRPGSPIQVLGPLDVLVERPKKTE